MSQRMFTIMHYITRPAATQVGTPGRSLHPQSATRQLSVTVSSVVPLRSELLGCLAALSVYSPLVCVPVTRER